MHNRCCSVFQRVLLTVVFALRTAPVYVTMGAAEMDTSLLIYFVQVLTNNSMIMKSYMFLDTATFLQMQFLHCRHTLLGTRAGANEYAPIRCIRQAVLLPRNLAITSYTLKPWHRRYYLNREPPYWLQFSITGSGFRGFILVLQNNSILKDTQMIRSKMGAFRCIHIHATRLAFVFD